MKGREDLVLTRLNQNAGMGRVHLDGSGTWLMMNQRTPTSGVIEVTSDQKSEVIISPGRYTLRLRTPQAVYEGVTTVTSGRTQRVLASQLDVVPFGRTIRKGYRENQNVVLGMTAGVVMTGAITEGIGPNLGAALGLRADFRPLSIEVRARGAMAANENPELQLNQRMVGADLTVLAF